MSESVTIAAIREVVAKWNNEDFDSGYAMEAIEKILESIAPQEPARVDASEQSGEAGAQ